MMHELEDLFQKNRAWAAQVTKRDPEFFKRLSLQQTPQYLWIGCADSRVPANEIIGLLPGELFVHRNISNLVVYTDLNCLSVLQYAVDVLQVKHIIVCGHYGCGGIEAAWSNRQVGLSDNWLRHVQDVQHKHQSHFSQFAGKDQQMDRLCELNVIEQVLHAAQTTIVQDAWARKQEISVHGWIYRLTNGLIRDLGLSVKGPSELAAHYEEAVRRLGIT
jgi:carbonic anhydrase